MRGNEKEFISVKARRGFWKRLAATDANERAGEGWGGLRLR